MDRTPSIIPPPPPPNRRSAVIQIILVVAILIGAVFLIFQLSSFNNIPAGPHIITYRIEGTTSQARITFTQLDGTASESAIVSVPWQKSGLALPPGTYVILTAGNPETKGTLRCIIYLDGAEWRKESADTPEGKVACGGQVP